jgi:hypothetical protein
MISTGYKGDAYVIEYLQILSQVVWLYRNLMLLSQHLQNDRFRQSNLYFCVGWVIMILTTAFQLRSLYGVEWVGKMIINARPVDWNILTFTGTNPSFAWRAGGKPWDCTSRERINFPAFKTLYHWNRSISTDKFWLQIKFDLIRECDSIWTLVTNYLYQALIPSPYQSTRSLVSFHLPGSSG